MTDACTQVGASVAPKTTSGDQSPRASMLFRPLVDDGCTYRVSASVQSSDAPCGAPPMAGLMVEHSAVQAWCKRASVGFGRGEWSSTDPSATGANRQEGRKRRRPTDACHSGEPACLDGGVGWLACLGLNYAHRPAWTELAEPPPAAPWIWRGRSRR
jgi:hypothetical protein